MQIAIIGAGQVGSFYAANLIEKLGQKPSDVVIHDIVTEKAQRLAAKYGAVVSESFPVGFPAAIVAASTPAHGEVITRLAKAGARHILTEKPLVFRPHELKRLEECRELIHTALVINFSPALTALKKIMDSSGTSLLEFYGSWGKPRPLDKIARPSAGDVEDESIHPIAFAHELLRGMSGQYVTACARVSTLPFVDPDVQSAARANDVSFPGVPNHSTTALLTYGLDAGHVPVDIRSSFLLAKQERKVGGILGLEEKPAYLFEVDFDLKGDGGTFDRLTIVDLEQRDTRTEMLLCDKLNDLTSAFVGSCTGSADPRLADFGTAAFLVRLQDAILTSAQRGRTKSLPLR